MTMVFLGVGTNTDREHHLGRGLDALKQLLGALDVSPVFESAAVGVLGHRFLNMIVGAQTHLSLLDLTSGLKAIEAACGRRDSPSPGRITLDIDILTYGDLAGEHQGLTLPRPEVLRNAFVLWPLALLAPDWSACVAIDARRVTGGLLAPKPALPQGPLTPQGVVLAAANLPCTPQ